MKRHTLLYLAFILLGINTLWASENDKKSSQSIRGIVLDKTSGHPLPGATIMLIDSTQNKGTASDANGQFLLEDVPLGRRSLAISFMGYQTALVNNLLLISGKQSHVKVELTEDITTFQEVIVKPESNNKNPLNKMAMVSGNSFSVEQTERFAGSLGDPARMVSNYAGVNMSNDSRNDIIIRGNSPSGVLWRLEDVEIANPNHFGASGTTGGPVAMINNNLLSNSDFFTGAFPAEYGNALSGAFDLHLRSGNSHKTEFTGQVGFNGFEIGLEGPLFTTSSGQKASYLANFRYSTLELMHQMGFGSGTGTAIPCYKDATYIIDIPGTKLGRFKIFGLWGDSWIELGRDYQDTTATGYNPYGTATDFGSNLFMTGISNSYFFNKKTHLKTTLSYQSTRAITILDSIKNQVAYPFIRQDMGEDKYGLSTKLTYKLNQRNHFNTGIKADFFNIHLVDSIKHNDYDHFITMNNETGKLTLIQAYAQWHHHFNSYLSTYLGLHSQFFDQNNETAFEPRAGLTYRLNPKQQLNFGFGLHSQIQNKNLYFEENYVSASNTYYRTNEDLKFTKSLHWVLGHHLDFNDQWRLKSEAYYQHLYRVPIKESFPAYSVLNAGANFGGARQDSLYNGGTGRNYGIEWTLERFLQNGFYVLFTTSLYESKYTGSDGIERNTAFNGNYVFNALAGYEFSINKSLMATIDLKAILAGGQRYIPINIKASQLAHSTKYDYDKAYMQKHDPYFRTDLRLGLKHNATKFSQEWAVDFQNISNYQSIYTEGYNVDKGEIYQVYQQGFYPMFLYRIQF